MYNLKMKIFRILMMPVLIILLCSWGNKGHQKINGSLPERLPARFKHFKEWTVIMSAHGSDADNRKKGDPSEGMRHYIDIDAYKDFVEKKKISEPASQVFTSYGEDFVMQNGTLPWVTDSTYRELVKQFRSKEWQMAVMTAADLGHYVGDGYMPLHLTLNYDGKLSGQTGIHSRYEITMVDRYIDQIVIDRIKPKKIADVNRYIFDYIYNNYQYKDSVLNADKHSFEKAGNEYSDLYYQELWNQTQGFTKELFSGASESLAELIRTAWIEAGRPRIPANIIFQESRK